VLIMKKINNSIQAMMPSFKGS